MRTLRRDEMRNDPLTSTLVHSPTNEGLIALEAMKFVVFPIFVFDSIDSTYARYAAGYK